MSFLFFLILSVAKQGATGSIDGFSSVDYINLHIRSIVFQTKLCNIRLKRESSACASTDYINPTRVRTNASVSVVTPWKEKRHAFATNIGAKPFSTLSSTWIAFIGQTMVEKRRHAVKLRSASETPSHLLPRTPDYETWLRSTQCPSLHPLRPNYLRWQRITYASTLTLPALISRHSFSSNNSVVTNHISRDCKTFAQSSSPNVLTIIRRPAFAIATQCDISAMWNGGGNLISSLHAWWTRYSARLSDTERLGRSFPTIHVLNSCRQSKS